MYSCSRFSGFPGATGWVGSWRCRICMPVFSSVQMTTRPCPKQWRALRYKAQIFCALASKSGAWPIVSGSIFAWRWSFQMQAVNMGDQFSFRGPATEVEAEHLIRPLGRCPSDPQADQQTRNEGGIDLDTHPIYPLA